MSIPMGRLVAVIFSSVLLLSCATPYGTVLARYDEAPVCCRELEEFQYEQLGIPDSKSFRIDENSQAFVFDTGKSYFRAFELPEYTEPYTITIKSYMVGDHIKSAYILRPAILLLDKRYDIARFLEDDLFRYTKTGLFETWGIRRMYEAEIPFDRRNAHERYMIILTTDKLRSERIAETEPVFIPIIFPGLVGAIPTGTQETVSIPHSPAGKLKIVVGAPHE